MTAGSQIDFPLPKAAALKWLCESDLQVAPEIRARLLGGMFGAVTVVYIGVFCTLCFNVVMVLLSSSLLFKILLPAGLAANLVRGMASWLAKRALAAGRRPPTDFYMWSAIAWYGGQGICFAAGLQSSSNPLQLLAMYMMMGASGAVCVRQFGAPRFGILLLCCNTLPMALAAALAWHHWLVVFAFLLPVYTMSMVSIVKAMEKNAVETLQARHDSHQLARNDYLTGVLNRFGLMETLAAMEASGQTSFALFCIDLDQFKPINDQYGHAAGDGLLKSVAARLTELARPGDIVARLGGDEFLLLAPGMGPLEAEGWARLVRQVITAQPHQLGSENEVSIDASVGHACAPQDGSSFPILYHKADAGLYDAKEENRKKRLIFT